MSEFLGGRNFFLTRQTNVFRAVAAPAISRGRLPRRGEGREKGNLFRRGPTMFLPKMRRRISRRRAVKSTHAYHNWSMEVLESRQLLSATLVHTTAAPLRSRVNLAPTATVGNLALFAGGFNGSSLTNTVDIYNAATGKWSTTALSQARDEIASVTVDHKVIFAGGQTVDGPNIISSNVVDIYGADRGRWSTTTLPEGRWGMACATVGNYAIFAGGYTTSGELSREIDIYNAKTGRWSLARLSEARSGMAVAVVGDKVLFAGGGYSDRSGIGRNSNVVDIFNSQTWQWSTATLSQARSPVAATVGDVAIFTGGNVDLGHIPDIPGVSDAVDIYNARKNKWTTATLSQPHLPIAATVGDLAIFAGAALETSNPLTPAVDIFNAATGSWSTTALPEYLGAFSAASVGSDAVFAGGAYPLAFASNLVEIYEADTGQWSTTTLSQSRDGVAAATVDATALFAGGGPSEAVDLFTQVNLSVRVTGVAHGQVTVTLANTGTSALPAGAELAVFAATTPTLGGDAVQLGAFGWFIRWRSGRRRRCRCRFLKICRPGSIS